MNDEGFLFPGSHSSYSVETIPSAPIELNESRYTPNVVHPVAGTRDTYQGGGTEVLQYGQGPSYALTFPSHFQQTSPNGSFKNKYGTPIQTCNDDQQRSNAVPGNEHSSLVPHGESSTAVCQTQQSPGTVRQQTNTANTGLDNAYRHLLRRIIKSLSSEEVDDLCYISTEANSSGVRNKANFSGIVLFKFFEQRMLITAENLEYLQNHLKNISRIDLCNLIDDYTKTHLNGSSFANCKPLSEPHPQGLHLEPHPLPVSVGQHPVESRPPPFNPDYNDHMPTWQQHNPVQCTCPEQVNTEEEYKLPRQVEDDGNPAILQSLQMDNLIVHMSSEQLHQCIRQLQTEVKFKTNDIHILSKKNDQQQLSLQQIEAELKAEREKSQQQIQAELKAEREKSQQQIENQKQICKHYLAHIEKLSAELQGKSGPAAERYSMRTWPHGVAVIINNYEFSSSHLVDKILPNRDGSLVDENNLRITWEYLGYKVQVLQNLKASELIHQLMQVALQNHENYDSFVCCILSHGEVDSIYGTDGELVKFNEIVKLFKGNFCPSLVNKPKLFFIQACRGDDTDKGVYQQKDGIEKIEKLLPNEADFFFGYATPPGYASWRSTEYGSWYIFNLCEVLVDNAPWQDLLNMSTMVTDKVSKAYTKEGYKQCPVPVSRLCKQVWFFGNI